MQKGINLSFDTKQLLRVSECGTAKDVQQKLEQTYDAETEENIEQEWSGSIQDRAKFDGIQTKLSLHAMWRFQKAPKK